MRIAAPDCWRCQEAEGTTNAHHIFVIRLCLQKITKTRDEVPPRTSRPDTAAASPALPCCGSQVYNALRAENIGVNVHYIPVHLHPYYQRIGFTEGTCPKAEVERPAPSCCGCLTA